LLHEQKGKHKETRAKSHSEGWISPNKGRVGRKHTAETRKKMSAAASGENNPNFGKKHTAESKAKISKALSGENNPRYGRKHSAETKEKMSAAKKGKKHSAESLEKMSAAKKGSNSPNWNLNREEVARRAAVRGLMWHYLNLRLGAKIDDHEVTRILGYSKSEFIAAIEGKFCSGMQWGDRGVKRDKWQMHHKIPVLWFVKFNVTDPMVINALDNLKLLWHLDHRKEHKRVRKFTKEQKSSGWSYLFGMLSTLDESRSILALSN